MTLDYCPHGYYRSWINGGCAVCFGASLREVHVPREPKLRDAAMWAAFVHEMRAEWIISLHSAALYLPDDRHEPAFDPNCPKCGRHDGAIMREMLATGAPLGVCLDDACPYRAPHAEHSDRVIAKLRAMTPEELRRTFVDAGIYDENGNLTEPYRG